MVISMTPDFIMQAIAFNTPIAGFMPDGTEFTREVVREVNSAPPPSLPKWLSSSPSEKMPKYPRTRDELTIEQITFDAAFEQVLDQIVMGESVMAFLRKDPRGIDYGRFMRWIDKDDERKHRYTEAQRIGTEALLEKADRIAAGEDDVLRDIERDKMMIRQIEFKVRTWNKQKYGDTKQVDINMNADINVRALLDNRQEQMRTLLGEFEVVDDKPVLLENAQ
jgi:hypothetical protein